MDARSIAEENLREAACIGDEQAVRSMLANGVNINSQNRMNGWSALHWASHRGHKQLVKALIDLGADIYLQNVRGQTPGHLAKDPQLQELLGGEVSMAEPAQNSLGDFQPNYLRSPQLLYVDRQSAQSSGPQLKPTAVSASVGSFRTAASMPVSVQTTLVVRARVADAAESDFVEVDVMEPTYAGLVSSCAAELEVQPERIVKIRKLPNVLVRKDKDVQRLVENAELEVILS